jgi:CheY-like chemotaxis protein
MLHSLRAIKRGSHRGARPALRRRILVVEDEYVQAENLQQELEDLGAEVLGPVPSVAAALALLAGGTPVDAAILDVSLGGEMVFPVAEALQARSIPFMFATGYDAWLLPSAYAHVPCCEKPFDVGDCVWALFGQTVAA